MEFVLIVVRLFVLGPLMVFSIAVGVSLLINTNIYEVHSIRGAFNQTRLRYKMHLFMGIFIGALIQITELLI